MNKHMKGKLYMLTYNSEHHLNEGLNSLFSSRLDNELEINIINNHTNFQLNESNADRLKGYRGQIYHNKLQPDWGTGHSSRNWNQAIIAGFKNLTEPDCDFVICVQDDHMYDVDWLSTVRTRCDEGMHFMSTGIGDGFCCYTPTAIKEVGLWDERFCSLHYGEHDYFLRAVSWLGEAAAITDDGGIHGHIYRFNDHRAAGLGRTPHREAQKEVLRVEREYQSEYARKLFAAKWGLQPGEASVGRFANQKLVPRIPSFRFYPYFEKDIDLSSKGYFI